MVLDNLKEGVLKLDLYEPELNPVYAATLAHYEVVADPARVRDPNRKGSVESAIGHTQATALKGDASRPSRRRTSIWSGGRPAGQPSASTAPNVARCRPCSRTNAPTCIGCR